MRRPDADERGDGAALSALLRCAPLLAGLLAALALAAVSWVGFGETRAALTGLRVAEASAAVRAVRADLNRAIGYGAPLDQLPGVEDYLAERAARLPELRFFAVIGPDGRGLRRAGVSADELDALLSPAIVSTMVAPPDGAAGDDVTALTVLAVGRFVVVRAPLRDGGGAVLAGVEPAEITRALTADMWAKWPFWAGCLLLPAAWMAAAARGGVAEPLGRLNAALRAAADGRFDTLLVRRSRDAVGRSLLAFNAVVAGLYARRQAFVAQADEVRHAVFDMAVADAVAAARDAALADLGDGLAAAPRRLHDPRASDADIFVATLAAAGALGGAAAAGLAGVFLTGAAAAGLVSMAALGVSAGVAARQRRRAAGAAGGWQAPWLAGVLAGAGLAWGLAGDPVVAGYGAGVLAIVALGVALGAALVAPQRRE